MMSGFAVAWLDLREHADRRARDEKLAERALQWLDVGASADAAESIVVDLGSGTGSTLRALARPGAGKIVWRLVDHDGALLDEALKRHRRHCLIEDYQVDLTAVAELPLRGARLVTASALFDLTSPAFITELVARISAGHGAGLYAALNYDGNTSWTPPHPLDGAVLEAFNRDQRRDKGMGPALGPAATGFLRTTLENAGYTVRVADSPWLLDASDHLLTKELVQGIAAAVAEGYELDAGLLQVWEHFRLAQAEQGTCRVGHQDLLALPQVR
jgi:SAM-dependent methyltransferase